MFDDSEDAESALGLTEASTDELRQVARLLGEGALGDSLSLSALSYRGLGHLSPMLVPFDGLRAQTVLEVVRVVLAERRRAAGRTLDLVWSGSDSGPSYARYTRIVVPEMIERVQRTLTIAGYSFDEGAGIFSALHQAINERDVTVRMFLDVEQLSRRIEQHLRKEKSRRSRLEPLNHARKAGATPFASEVLTLFRELYWPFEGKGPELYYDPRTADHRVFASLHAKCVIADEEHVLITSANFTGRGQDRNIEVGIVVHDKGYASALERQWNNLVESGDVVRG